MKFVDKSSLASYLTDTQCSGCDDICAPKASEDVVVDATVKDPGEIVKREPVHQVQKCLYVCRHAGCERICYDNGTAPTAELAGALVIDAPEIDGAVSVEVVEQDGEDDVSDSLHN